MTQQPHWQRPSKVIDEIKRTNLTPDEATRLANLMDRFASGRTFRKDHCRLRDGVEELRLDGNHRIFRLYFGRIDSGLVLLMLHFKAKKKDNDRVAIDKAADRLKRWRDHPEET